MISKLTGEGAAAAEGEVQKKPLQFSAITATFEHRDENKTCSACREWLNERLKECESEKEWEWDRVGVRKCESKFWAYTWKQKLFRPFKHSYIPGSQLLSDIQTFFCFMLGFFYHHTILTRSCDIRVHRAGSQLKSMAIFGYKHQLLSIEMKIKVVQHVPRINLSHLNF